MEASARISLTQSQYLIWAGQQLNPDSPMYNMAHTFEIHGKLNIAVFQEAFQELIQRASNLRIVFDEENGIPYQYILPELLYKLEYIDFTASQKNLEGWLKEKSQEKFDISRRLFDTKLLKIGTQKYIWFLNVHHLITDATTSTLLYKSMSVIYSNILAGNKEKLLEIPNYLTYVNRENHERNQKKNEITKKYWENKFGNAIEFPKLYGRKRLGFASDSTRVLVEIGAKRSKALLDLAEKPEIRSWTRDLTLFNLFFTILSIYVYRVSGQQQFSIGAPSHNRFTKKDKITPGLFIEVLPLLSNIDDSDTFYSVLKKVKIEVHEYLKNAQAGTSGAATSKSFSIMLNYINVHFPDFSGNKMKSEWIHPDHSDALHELRCNVYDMDNSGIFKLYLDLNNDVFDAILRKNVPLHFLKIVDDILNDIHSPILQSSLVTEDEITEIHADQYDFDDAFGKILTQFQNVVKTTPQAVALHYLDNSMCYDELDKKSTQFANYLKSVGIGKGDRVSLFLHRSPEFIISVLAVLKLGGIYIPIASNMPAKRVSYILKDSKSKIVITDHILIERLEKHETSVIAINKNEVNYSAFDNTTPSVSLTDRDVAYIIYTSGSTGTPKGVEITHGGLSNYLGFAKKTYVNINPPVFPLFTSIGFDLTITATFLPLVSGGTIVVYKENDYEIDLSLIDVLKDNRVNSIKLTPSHLSLVQEHEVVNSKIKTMIVGGEDLKINLAKSIQDFFGDSLTIYNEYGPTEATVGCIVSKYEKKQNYLSSVPIGKPIPNTKAYVLDAYKNKVPKGVIGTLYISGKGLSNGYVNLSELTRERFIENPYLPGEKLYNTGDLVRINEAGDFEFCGRIDEQLKFKGYRIEVAEIEANILKYPDVSNAIVMLHDSDREFLVAYYTGEIKIKEIELKRLIFKTLPQYMIPEQFIYVNDFPFTVNGKIDKAKLKTYFVEVNTKKEEEYTPPDTEIEEFVAVIWQEVLKMSNISVLSNYIALGGDSLAAIRITSRVSKALELQVSLDKIFEFPTIRQYASYIEKLITKLLEE